MPQAHLFFADLRSASSVVFKAADRSLRAAFVLFVLALVGGAALVAPRALEAQTATVTPTWVHLSPATSPSVRLRSSMAYDAATSQMVLFSGTNNVNDTWIFNGSNWTQASPAMSPSSRLLSTMAYDPMTGVVVLFGGIYGSSTFGDTWTFNGSTWTQQSISGPSARDGASMVYDPLLGQIVLFGGQHSGGNLNDTWTYNGTTWTQQFPPNSPSVRFESQMAYDPAIGQVVLYGGSSGSSVLGDTWLFNGGNWVQQFPATSPPAKDIATMAFDTATNQVLLFGGASAAGGATNDTWTYDGNTWTQQLTSASPTARYGAAMALQGTSEMVLFGGNGLNDTWAYQAAAPVLPATAVGTAAAQVAVSFSITAAGTLPSLSNANVLTQGLANLDFTLGTGSTCTGTVTAGQTCTVNVAFTPAYPGLRMGAVNLLNSGGVVIATAYISGTGTGPLGTFAPGILSTVAGSGVQCPNSVNPCGDGGPATASGVGFYNPNGVAVDGAGNLYISDYVDHRIRKVTAATGIISTVAGNGTQCAASTAPCGDGSPAINANLAYPSGVAIDGAGNLYIADQSDNRIREVNAATGIISTVAGNGNPCSPGTAACGDGGPAAATGPIGANLNGPASVAVDGGGNLYIADTQDHRIRKVSAATGLLSTVAGTGTACTPSTAACGDGSAATAAGAALAQPAGVTVDSAGNLYIADKNDNRIREVTVAGVLSTIAGTGTACSGSTAPCGDTGPATSANLHTPTGVAVDASGNVYIADSNDQRVRVVSTTTGLLMPVAGFGNPCSASMAPCGDGGPATAAGANLYFPAAVALDSAGNLYFADQGDLRIRKVSTGSSINFPTPTAANTLDTTDGTRTAMLNNIGNAPLQLNSMIGNNPSYIGSNPMNVGCSTSVAVVAGTFCLLGEQFQPIAGSGPIVPGSLAVSDNSLNVTGVQTLPLVGGTVSGGLLVTTAQVVVSAGAPYAALNVTVSYSGALPDHGAISITVNGSTAGVSAPTCISKGAHVNCSYTYTGAILNTAGYYPIAVNVAADPTDSYAAGTASNTLIVNAVAGHTVIAPLPKRAVQPGGRTVAQPMEPVATAPVGSGAAVLVGPVSTDDATVAPAADSRDAKDKAPKQP